MLNFEMLPAHFSFTYFYVTDEITLFAIFYQCFIGKELSEFYFRCISTVIQKSAFFIEQYGVFSGGVGCCVCAAGLSETLSLWPYHRPHLSHLEKSNFRNPNLVTFCLCIYLINPFNLVILK